MPVHEVGGESVEVSTRTRNFFFYKSQGIRIEVSPERHWWCLWLCSTTKEIDLIQCSIILSDSGEPAEASGSCEDCGDLNVMGPSFWGFNFPWPYARVAYQGVVQIDGERYSISGTILY